MLALATIASAVSGGCSHSLSLGATVGPNLARPSIVDARGRLPIDPAAGGVAGARASIGLGRGWTLHAGTLLAHERFASTELPTDTPVRLTSLALEAMAGFTPRRGGRLELLAGWRPAWPLRARRAFRDEDQDVLRDYRPADLALVLGAGAWLDGGRRLRAELRYAASLTDIDATGWYDLERRSLEIVLSYRLWHREPRP